MADTRIAVFLGAGASKAEGAPLQAELFRSYFEYSRSPQISCYGHQIDIDRQLAKFFKTFFGIDLDHDDLKKAEFPTFEEALGILELAISRDESFKGQEPDSRYRVGAAVQSAQCLRSKTLITPRRR